MEHGITHVSTEELEELGALADRIVAILLRAGLSAVRDNAIGNDYSGASIDIDPVRDSACGVYVKWLAHPEVRAGAQRALLANDFTNADIAFAGAVSEAMCAAIIHILRAGGVEAQEADDMRPFDVHISLRARPQV